MSNQPVPQPTRVVRFSFRVLGSDIAFTRTVAGTGTDQNIIADWVRQTDTDITRTTIISSVIVPTDGTTVEVPT